MKTPYTDDEIEQLTELYSNHYYLFALVDSMRILQKELGYSDIHKDIICLRKYMNKKSEELWDKYNEKWKDSNLDSKLILRMNEEDSNNII